jgi:hypothetical protein
MRLNGWILRASPGAASLLVCACLLLIWGVVGCAPLYREKPPAPDKDAGSIWAAFWSRQDRAPLLPGASLQGSLNIFTPEQKRRITFELWGNQPTPLRLHLRAGLGATISVWEVRDDRTLIFNPRENRAYVADNTAQATAALGLRLPFGLPDLTKLLTGSWQGLLPREYERVETARRGGYAYFLQGDGRIDRVVLDGESRVVALSGDRPYGWNLERKALSIREDRFLSQRVDLTTQRGEELILRVKEFEPRSTPWPESDLRLSLPPDTMLQSLRP